MLLGSGFSALVYQMVWLRELRLIFGSSTSASAVVLAIFMGGLGFGALLFGPRADRTPRPLALYARLELGIALTAAATPLLLGLVSAIYRLTGGSPVLGSAWASALRLLLAALILAVPTLLMGGTLPAVTRAVQTDDDVGRRRVAWLYGANTLGGVAGVMLATFVLFESIGIRQTLWLACLVNLGVAGVAWQLARGQRDPDEADEPGGRESTDDGAGVGSPVRLVLAAALLAGFAFLAMELVWYRMLAPLLGGTTYTFGLILALVLMGIAAGGATYAIAWRNRPATLRLFAWTCTAEALCIALPFALGDRLAVLALLLQPLGNVDFILRVAAWAFTASLVVLPASLVAGFQFPVLIALLGRGRRHVGREVGLGYAWNTLGGIVGALAGGFVLIPAMTAPGLWIAAVYVLLALAAVTLIASLVREGDPLRLIAPAALFAAALGLSLAEGPTAAWRHSPIGAGRAQLGQVTRNAVRDWVQERRRAIIWEEEGSESSVALQSSAGLGFLINGKSDGNIRMDAATQVMYGLVGGILHPEPQNAFVIGLGSGSTAGWLAAIPTMERVEVAELEPALLEVAARGATVNLDVLDNPKVEVVLGDAREVLLTSKRRYDLIASEPSNPYRAGVASLFTREFYRAVSERLEQDGIFLQWVQAYEVDGETVRTIMATLADVFSHVETWQTDVNDLLFVCSSQPVRYDAAALRARIAQAPFERALGVAWRTDSLEGLLARFIATPALAGEIAGRQGDRLNTDNRPRVEFSFADTLGQQQRFRVESIRELAVERGWNRPPGLGSAVDWNRVVDERVAMYTAWDSPPETEGLQRRGQFLRAESQSRYLEGDYRGALGAWGAQPLAPRGPVEVPVVADLLAESGSENALAYIARVRATQPIEADVLLARLRLRQEQTVEAARLLSGALIGYREDPWPWPVLMGRAVELAREIATADPQTAARLFESLAEPFVVHQLDEQRKAAAVWVGYLAGTTTAARGVGLWEPHVPWEREFLTLRARRYRDVGDPRTALAERQLSEFLERAPKPFDDDSP